MQHIPRKWKALRPWQRHSTVLLGAGMIYIAFGLSIMFTAPIPSRVIALRFALDWLSFAGWGWVFMFAGLLAVISSRWPPVSRTWGYTVLTGLSSAWSMFYLVGIGFGDAPMMNITGTLTWGLIGFLWWAISGLNNPPHPSDFLPQSTHPETKE